MRSSACRARVIMGSMMSTACGLPCASARPVGRMGPNGKQPDYGDPSRRIAARFRAGYEILFTRQLTPEPEFEVNAHGRSDPVRRDAQPCLHPRYEAHQPFSTGHGWPAPACGFNGEPP
jgi:hypothetical protein